MKRIDAKTGTSDEELQALDALIDTALRATGIQLLANAYVWKMKVDNAEEIKPKENKPKENKKRMMTLNGARN